MQGNESEFRKVMQTTLDRVERAFENVDPDVAECEQSLGSMTINPEFVESTAMAFDATPTAVPSASTGRCTRNTGVCTIAFTACTRG